MKNSTTNFLVKLFALFCLLLSASTVFGAYYMKHPWGGGNWTYKQLNANNEITDTYGGNGVNIATSSNDLHPVTSNANFLVFASIVFTLDAYM
jgi:hypothetical protein